MNHSGDIDPIDFLKTYRECTKERFNFLTTRLKLINKIKANQAQFDLDREATKRSALSSKDLLEKYNYLTSEDLGHPSMLEKSKLEYSPLNM